MRKMLNKKGFSLVELMIVVVIMGILIAVAIPLYGAITKNANNKTCGTNIKNIKSNAATYSSTYNTNVSNLAELKSMFDDGNMPECPLSKDGVYDDYTVAIATNGAAEVQCKNNGTDGHAPDGHAATLTGTALV
ncbi:MAG: prepilin-type N-terminal cleavage/methylation domain-containing protein [Oscillospiraceae bacterium]|nr:prepilin-type N-terminal cleavage/methylation domain-containing protein [Oscillospiraceae bacterium]